MGKLSQDLIQIKVLILLILKLSCEVNRMLSNILEEDHE